MKLSVDSQHLAQAVYAAKAAAGKVNGVDVALLKAVEGKEGAGGLLVAAANTSMQSHTTIDAKVEGAGELCINIDDLASIARHLPKDGDVVLSLDGTSLEIVTPRSKYRFGALDSGVFSPWNQTLEGEPTAVPADALARALAGVSHAVSPDASMVQLTGVLLTDHGGDTPARAVATDGHRLACRDVAGGLPGLPAGGIVVPAKTCKEIERLCSGAGMVGFLASGSVLEIDGGPEVMLAKLIDAPYPEYRGLLSQEFPHAIEIDRKLLLDSVARVGSILTKQPILRLILDAVGLHLRADRDQAAGMETVASFPVAEDARIEIGLNIRYLSDALKALSTPTAKIEYRSADLPVRIVGAGDPTFIQIIMPARL